MSREMRRIVMFLTLACLPLGAGAQSTTANVRAPKVVLSTPVRCNI